MHVQLFHFIAKGKFYIIIVGFSLLDNINNGSVHYY